MRQLPTRETLPAWLNGTRSHRQLFIENAPGTANHGAMYLTRKQLDDALARLKTTLPQMVAEHPDVAGFSAAFRSAAAAIEAQAGRHARYVSRSIDTMLASLVLASSPTKHPRAAMHGHLVN